jgi:hypothetical protein
LAVLTGTGMVVFVSFFPLLLLTVGTLVHPSIRKLHFAFVGSAIFGVIALLLSIWIGKFVYSRIFASFTWRIVAGICLTAWSVLLVMWLASGQYRGGFTRAAYGGAEVDQGLLYGFG